MTRNVRGIARVSTSMSASAALHRAQRGCVTQQDEIVLVRIQRMRERVRRDHRQIARDTLPRAPRVRHPRSRNPCSGCRRDRCAARAWVSESASTDELARIDDERANAMRLEQRLEQQEFGEQVLLARGVVDDGDGSKRLVAARQPPLLHEHVHDRLRTRLGRRLRAQEFRRPACSRPAAHAASRC